MKYDIIIKDINQNDLNDIVSRLNRKETVVPVAKVEVTSPHIQTLAPGAVQIIHDEEEASNVDVSGQIDAEGLPWDSRIHSSNKKKTAKNVWTRRRGLQESEYARVKNELLTATYVNPSVQVVPANGDISYVSPVPAFPSPTHPIPAPTAPVMPTPQSIFSQRTLTTLFTKIQQALGAGRIDATYIPALLGKVNTAFNINCNSITDFTNRQDLIDYAHTVMESEGF